MQLRSTAVRTVMVCSVFVVGIAVGTISIGSTLANTTYSNKEQTQSQKPQTPNYPKNTNGQTYGSGLGVTSPETEPDLLQAIGLDGTEGYVKSKDLKGEQPKTPKEAALYMQSLTGDREIPLYDVDGKKVIGAFKIQLVTPIETKANKGKMLK